MNINTKTKMAYLQTDTALNGLLKLTNIFFISFVKKLFLYNRKTKNNTVGIIIIKIPVRKYTGQNKRYKTR